MKIEWMRPSRRAHRANTDVALALSPLYKDGKIYGTLITIYEKLMTAQGLKVGDRLIVGRAGTKHLALARVDSDGWYLSAQGKSGEERESLIGTHAHSCLKLTFPITDSKVTFTMADLKTTAAGELLFPKPPAHTHAAPTFAQHEPQSRPSLFLE